MSRAPIIHWFRRDLRLADNAALAAAAAAGPVVAVYVLAEGPESRPIGGASRWWLGRSLAALSGDLARHGLGLVLRRGEPARVLAEVAAGTGAAAVHWCRLHEPAEAAIEERVRAALGPLGVACRRYPGGLLHEPESIRNQAGQPFRVYTPFARACRAAAPPRPALPVPALTAAAARPASEDLAAWGLQPGRPDWSKGLAAAWQPGEAGAEARLGAFLAGPLARYREARDLPGIEGTSRLSPHLHFGEISPRRCWLATTHAGEAEPGASAGAGKLQDELLWREFAAHLLHHWPELPARPFRAEFERFPARQDPSALALWQRGRTGYPLIDAGQRELWATGWMHNRVRMAVASFLTKHLLLPWQAGEAWFWDTLVDADLANNVAGWQWVAGCGADAAPYFRIFNPVSQGRKFDAGGHYVRRWLPELARLPDALVHAPWEAAPAVLAAAGVRLGETYPRPIVEHGAARARALAALASLKAGAPGSGGD